MKKKKHFWVILLISLSYIITYFVPIILMYFALKDSFISTYIVKKELSLSFIGFVIVSTILGLAFLIKLIAKLIKTRASVFKYIFFGLMTILLLLFFVYILVKINSFTYVIEIDMLGFLNKTRGLLITMRNYLIVFMCCVGASTMCKVGALLIDKEYVKGLEWM